MITIEKMQLFSKDEIENAGACFIYVDTNKIDFEFAQKSAYNAINRLLPDDVIVLMVADGLDLQFYDTHDLYIMRQAIDAAIQAKIDKDFEEAKNGDLD